MIRLNIDGREVTGYEGQTILQVAADNGITIPTLCHDERVKPQGACGLCVVEVEGTPRLLRACATIAADRMIIKTHSPRIKKSRQTALALLLSNHTGDCRPPCLLACPAQTDCQGYISLIANGRPLEAAALIKDRLPIPASIGRICPHPCEKECRRQLKEEPVNIAELKYFAADRDLQLERPYMPPLKPETGYSVAIVGGGPAGLTAAYCLKREGHHTVIYDAMPKMGGLLRYGIPEYRLPKAVLDAETDALAGMGIVFCNNVKLGKDITLPFLQENYDAVVIATGAWVSRKMDCPGETLPGVIAGIDFLRDVVQNKPVPLGKRVAVIGGSNTAMDAARTALRLGAAEVFVVYRRTRAEMPAEPAELLEAEAEGVQFKYLAAPLAISRDEEKSLLNLRLQQMELGEPDAGGRRAPVPVEGAEETLVVDTVIAAIGQQPNLTGLESLPLNRRGALAVAPNTFSAGLENVFAIGDVTGQSAYAIEAIGHAHKAALAVHAYLSGLPEESVLPHTPPILSKAEKKKSDFDDIPAQLRENAFLLEQNHQKAARSFAPLKQGLTLEQAEKEASRCLSCGCNEYYACKLLRYANEYEARFDAYTGSDFAKKHEPIDDSSPFFTRDPDKCILCGLCVRVCEETMGLTALGIMERGFEASVRPAFGIPVEQSDCINCGQCVALCPTGALTEKLPLAKTLVAPENAQSTVCAFCSVGCKLKQTASSGVLLRSLPDTEQNPLALLCAKGRFGFGILNRMEQEKSRLKMPLVRVNGLLAEADFSEAFKRIRYKLQAILSQYGPDAVAVSISDRYTNEDAYLIKTYARQVIGTQQVFCFNGFRSGLGDVTGRDASTNRFEEMAQTDVIVLAAPDMMETHTIAAISVKKAVENGAKLILLAPEPERTQVCEWATLAIPMKNMESLGSLVKAVAGLCPKPANAEGYDALCAYLNNMPQPDASIQEAALLYAKAKRAMIVFDGFSLTHGAARLLADMAVLAGHIAKPRSGIIQLKPNNNSQGLTDLGVDMNADVYIQRIREGHIKALLVFGENIPSIDLSPLEFLMVQDITLTETAQKADVLLPAAAFTENAGTYTNTVRIRQKALPSLPSFCGLQNWQIIQSLANDPALSYRDLSFIEQALCREHPIFNEDLPVLHADGFAFPHKKAQLLAPEEKEIFQSKDNTNVLRSKKYERPC